MVRFTGGLWKAVCDAMALSKSRPRAHHDGFNYGTAFHCIRRALCAAKRRIVDVCRYGPSMDGVYGVWANNPVTNVDK